MFKRGYSVKGAKEAGEITNELSDIAKQIKTAERELQAAKRLRDSNRIYQAEREVASLKYRAEDLVRRLERMEFSNPTGRSPRIVAVTSGEAGTLEREILDTYRRERPEEYRRFLASLSRADRERLERVVSESRIARAPRVAEVRPARATRRADERAARAAAMPRISRVRPARGERRVEARIPVEAKAGKPVIPEIKDSAGRALTKQELEASVAWKQGFMYKLIYPPYGEKDIINTREPIPGIKYHEGPRSAYLSLTKIYRGELPARIQRDMGIMDIEIERGSVSLSGKKGKPKIKFRRDVKQRTQTTPMIGTVK